MFLYTIKIFERKILASDQRSAREHIWRYLFWNRGLS